MNTRFVAPNTSETKQAVESLSWISEKLVWLTPEGKRMRVWILKNEKPDESRVLIRHRTRDVLRLMANGECLIAWEVLGEGIREMTPEWVKERDKDRKRMTSNTYYTNPKNKARAEEYRNKPETKEKRKAYNKTYSSKPENRARAREYYALPKNRAKERERAALPKNIAKRKKRAALRQILKKKGGGG